MFTSSKEKFIDVTDYGPPSMLFVPDDAAIVNALVGSFPLENKLYTPIGPSYNTRVNTRQCFETWKSTAVVSTCTQTDLECRCGNSCWYGKEIGWLNKLNTTNKRKNNHDMESRGKVHFGNLTFAPTFGRRKQFQVLSPEKSIAMESSNTSKVDVGESLKVADVELENSGNNYKQIFKEIFLLLQNAHNM